MNGARLQINENLNQGEKRSVQLQVNGGFIANND